VNEVAKKVSRIVINDLLIFFDEVLIVLLTHKTAKILTEIALLQDGFVTDVSFHCIDVRLLCNSCKIGL
jgi:hypothetical protein